MHDVNSDLKGVCNKPNKTVWERNANQDDLTALEAECITTTWETEMEIAVEEVNGMTVVYPEGPRLDAATAPRFKSAMVDVINKGTTQIILDLSLIDFMDSTGLASMMSTMKTLASQGEVVVCGVSEKLRMLFSIAKLDRGLFRIFEGRAEALNGF
jgi:anti-sigma B factor antagonist